MSTNCCVKSCKSFWTPITHLSFFRLPIHKENLKNKWLEVGPGYRSFTKNARICSDHFSPQDYKILSGKRILNRNAVPSIFDDQLINATKNVPEVGLMGKQCCGSFTENTKFYQALDLSRRKYKCDVGAQVPLHDSEAKSAEMASKKFRSVFVQTEPRILGPSPEVLALRHENKLLKDRLRKKEKRISSIIDLVQQLKDRACLGSVHEDNRLKRKQVAVKEAGVKKKARREDEPQPSAPDAVKVNENEGAGEIETGENERDRGVNAQDEEMDEEDKKEIENDEEQMEEEEEVEEDKEVMEEDKKEVEDEIEEEQQEFEVVFIFEEEIKEDKEGEEVETVEEEDNEIDFEKGIEVQEAKRMEKDEEGASEEDYSLN